jgi:hypothetical protein
MARKEGRYKELEAEWERQRKLGQLGAANWLIDPVGAPLDALPFLQILRRLGYVTQSRRFLELHRALIRSGLIDDQGHWSRYGMVLANPETEMTCELIEEGIALGMTERVALAEAVVELGIEAASFSAAVERMRVLLHEWRRAKSKEFQTKRAKNLQSEGRCWSWVCYTALSGHRFTRRLGLLRAKSGHGVMMCNECGEWTTFPADDAKIANPQRARVAQRWLPSSAPRLRL